MSAGRFILEDFAVPQQASNSTAPSVTLPAAPDPAELEARISASWEKGFKAGWDDCNAAVEADKSRISEAFGRRLGEIDLSLKEMRTAMLSEIEPLFADIFQKILPFVLQQTFQPRLIDEIRALANETGEQTLVVSVCREDAEAFEMLVQSMPDLPACEIRADATLGLSQATIQLSDSERHFDMAALLETIERTFEAYSETMKETSHG